MYKYCATPESAARQRELEQRFLTLLQQMPFSQITVGDLCDFAGLSRKTFYRYFSSKEGCLCAMLDHVIMDSAIYFLEKSTSRKQLQAVFTRFFTYWQQQAGLLDALRRDNLEVRLVERAIRYVSGEENQLLCYFGGNRQDLSQLSVFYVSGMMGLTLSWHRGGFAATPGQMAAIAEELFPCNTSIMTSKT